MGANPDEPYWRQENVNPEDDSKKTKKQLREERKQREAERARRDAERAKKRLEAKRAKENTGAPAAPEEKQDDVTSTPNEDLNDRVDQVLRDFADMKDDFRQTIDELGTHVEAVMEGQLAEAYIAMGQKQARDSKKSKKQLEREQREA